MILSDPVDPSEKYPPCEKSAHANIPASRRPLHSRTEEQVFVGQGSVNRLFVHSEQFTMITIPVVPHNDQNSLSGL
jgi:hypothetical protein